MPAVDGGGSTPYTSIDANCRKKNRHPTDIRQTRRPNPTTPTLSSTGVDRVTALQSQIRCLTIAGYRG